MRINPFSVLFTIFILSNLQFKVNSVKSGDKLYKSASEQEQEAKDTEISKSKADSKSNPSESSQTSAKKNFTNELLEKYHKMYKYSQAGLKLAKERLDSEAYTKLKIEAHTFTTRRNENQRKRRVLQTERFKKGTQTEKDVNERIFSLERSKRRRVENKKKKQKEDKKKGIQDTNHALAQLFPSKTFKDRISKPAKRDP